MMAPRITTAQVEQMTLLHAQGMCPRAIAARLGVSAPTVQGYLRLRGGLAPPRPRIGDAEITRAVELYQRGQSLRRVADDIGVCPLTIRRRLGERGVAVRRQGRPGYEEERW